MVHRYTLFGLTIGSELQLPELHADGIEQRPLDVEIRLGPVDKPDRTVNVLDMLVSVQPESTSIEVPEVGRFRIVEGQQIIVNSMPGCSEDTVRLYLLGSAFGGLLYQRGMLPLHANAIEIDGRAYAFAGPSGSGKSTLAAYFNDRGYRVLCDDVCALSFADNGSPLAWPGLPRLKLWADALEARGQAVERFRRITEDHDKYHFPVQTAAREGPFPLARLYDLAEPGQGTESRIARLSGSEARHTVLSNIYRRRLAGLSMNPLRHLNQVASLIQHSEIYVIQRRWGYEQFSTEAEKLENHLKS